MGQGMDGGEPLPGRPLTTPVRLMPGFICCDYPQCVHTDCQNSAMVKAQTEFFERIDDA